MKRKTRKAAARAMAAILVLCLVVPLCASGLIAVTDAIRSARKGSYELDPAGAAIKQTLVTAKCAEDDAQAIAVALRKNGVEDVLSVSVKDSDGAYTAAIYTESGNYAAISENGKITYFERIETDDTAGGDAG